MGKDCTCGVAVLSILILVFSFWEIVYSKWIIVVEAALILIKAGYHLAKHGCTCKGDSCCTGKGKKGEEVSITGDPTAKMPDKKELKAGMDKPALQEVARLNPQLKKEIPHIVQNSTRNRQSLASTIQNIANLLVKAAEKHGIRLNR